MDFCKILHSGVLLRSVKTLGEGRLIWGAFLKPTEGKKKRYSTAVEIKDFFFFAC
jgi:hypothetical protein